MSEERTVPFSIKELADAAGVHVSAVRQLCQAGKLDAFKVGNTWAIPADVGRAWLKQRRDRWEKY